MKEIRFFYAPDAAVSDLLPADEVQHVVKVLRLREGDELMLMDGKGTHYRAEITATDNHHCYYSIKETLPQERQWQGHLHLAIAPTKLIDRIEWMVEKAVEIGVDEISFLNCRFSERQVIKKERIEKIVVSAAKQSHKAWMPKVNDMVPFNQFIKEHQDGHRFIAHCYEEVPRTYLFDELKSPTPALPLRGGRTSQEDILVMIGPEGDFSIDEVQSALAAGYRSISLGNSRLRTETAGLFAVMMMRV